MLWFNVAGMRRAEVPIESVTTGSAAAQLYYYRYPRDIWQACMDLATAMWGNRSRQGLQSERLGDYSYTVAGTSMNKGQVQSILEDRIRGYRKVRF